MNIYLTLAMAATIGLGQGPYLLPVTTALGGMAFQASQIEIPEKSEVEKKAPPAPAISHSLTATITAYSSTPEETDDTPFITASGTYTRHGIVATNMLPMGTKIQIPDLYGNEVFVVEDRMHSRYQDRVDIWMDEKGKALKFGKKEGLIVVLK